MREEKEKDKKELERKLSNAGGSDEAELKMTSVIAVMALIFVDTITYSFCIPFFPRLVQDAIPEDVWLKVQTVSYVLGAYMGTYMGRLGDSYGRLPVLKYAQKLSSWSTFAIFLGVVLIRMDLGDLVKDLESHKHPGVVFLLAGFVFRKANRIAYICKALLTELSDSQQQHHEYMSLAKAVMGAGTALGPLAASLCEIDSSIFPAHFLFLFLFSGMSQMWTESYLVRFMRNYSGPQAVNITRGTRVRTIKMIHLVGYVLRKEGALAALIVYYLSFLAQYSYISTISGAALTHFGMSHELYSYLICYFGLSYSICMIFLIPIMERVFTSYNSMLYFSLSLVAVCRFGASLLNGGTVNFLFPVHFFTSVGITGIQVSLYNSLTASSKEDSMVGSMSGLMDTIHKIAAASGPFFMDNVSARTLKNIENRGLFAGGFVSGFLYLMTLFIALILPLRLENTCFSRQQEQATRNERSKKIKNKND